MENEKQRARLMQKTGISRIHGRGGASDYFKSIGHCIALCTALCLVPWMSGCNHSVKKDPQYVSIITPWRNPDSATIARIKDPSAYPGRVYSAVQTDSSFIRKNLSDYIIPFVRQLPVVKEIKDVSNNDSSVIVIRLCDTCNETDSRWIIEDELKAHEKDMPMYMDNIEVVVGKRSR